MRRVIVEVVQSILGEFLSALPEDVGIIQIWRVRDDVMRVQLESLNFPDAEEYAPCQVIKPTLKRHEKLVEIIDWGFPKESETIDLGFTKASISIKDGDTLVIKTKRMLSKECVEIIKENVLMEFPKNKVIVLCDDFDIQVMRQEKRNFCKKGLCYAYQVKECAGFRESHYPKVGCYYRRKNYYSDATKYICSNEILCKE